MIIATTLLISLAISIIPKSFYFLIFSKNEFFDSIVGGLAGSFSAGSPIVSYIIGGELISEGVGLVAVTAFLVSWVTVGLVQIPAEMLIFGKKFAIWRNLTGLFLSIVVAMVTVFFVSFNW